MCIRDRPRPVEFGNGEKYTHPFGGYFFVVEGFAGCPVQQNFIERTAGGLGWGWTFVICLAVVTLIYCAIGVCYKVKKVGVTGIEAIPNIEFWRDYPALVQEGCAYSLATISGCIGKSGGGGYSAV
eukprot:TRINITY_DN9319_c0_g1_i1.p1 TRINITY_DN9319_c0_g1~~TRINITY_DN9319_c0_g1_i1.p1  ORF type:complete len:126 (+),score=18.40 TRINITY_DN9319_c0_g1_i1:135-512(+)